MVTIATKAFFVSERCVLLVPRKSGRWKGYWDSYGGKVDCREPVKTATVREVLEESTVLVYVRDLEQVAVVRTYEHGELRFELHVFIVRKWSGTPRETEEEGVPAWFPIERLPRRMRPTDREWVERSLAGHTFEARVYVHPDGSPARKTMFRPRARFL